MNISKIITFSIILFSSYSSFSQSDLEQIQTTLNDYIDGTANGNSKKVKNVFHEDLNLYFIKNDSLKTWFGKNYIKNIKEGQKSNRVGKIVSIHIVNKIATAIVEIDMPNSKKRYIDFMLLSKVNSKWKILHKAFTFNKY